MLLDRDKSAFVLVDAQEKLIPFILNHDAIVGRCQWLIRLAQELKVPMLVSEQYPKGLGKTIAALHNMTLQEPHIEKVDFSCYRELAFIKRWQAMAREQVVLAGIETHVCVMQTAIDMHHAGVDVFVVVDAVSSRYVIDHQWGLERMKQAGIHLVTAEMVFFEWVSKAGTPEFKTLSQSYLR